MPYKEGEKWRAVVKSKGERLTRLFETKRDALNWESEIRKQRKETQLSPPKQPGLDLLTFCTKYLGDAETSFTSNTFGEKKFLCRRMLTAWGNDIMVGSITPEMVSDFINAQATSRSNNAANRDRKNMMAMWNWGDEILKISINPVRKIRKKPHNRRTQYVPPTADVLAVLQAATREERIFLECYLQTGARRCEIFRLTWADDINFERQEIRLGTRKTKDGSMEYEWIPMSSDLYNSLMWWWKNRPIKDTPNVFVDTNPGKHYGKPYSTRRRFMIGLCVRAGVRPFGFHAMRRYVASCLADTHKISSKTIQRILRHKNLTTTEKYIYRLNNDLKGVMDLLSREKGHEEGHENESGLTGQNP